MLQHILSAAGFTAERCAALIGIDEEIFQEWAAGQREIPSSIASLLANVLGVRPEVLASSRRSGRDSDILPAMWFKLRGDRLTDGDRESVLLMRALASLMTDLEDVTGFAATGWQTLFESIRKAIDSQAPPREQGREAARQFLASTGLSSGAKGMGRVFRGKLRNLGMLVVETPIAGSVVEGLCFYLGNATGTDRPCIFANTYGMTWFRRNVILMHEVGHAIFDAPTAGATLDLSDHSDDSLVEERAQAFALEVLVPERVLRHLSQGMDWTALTAENLATLVAETQVEARTVIQAAVDNELLPESEAERLRGLHIDGLLKEISSHALSTNEYVKKFGPAYLKRKTTIPARQILLPLRYVGAVVEAVERADISVGKGAEFLMIDEDDYRQRFPAS